MTSKAYKMGYEMARAELEAAKPEQTSRAIKKAMKETMYEFHKNEGIFEGICDAMYDYQNGNSWQF